MVVSLSFLDRGSLCRGFTLSMMVSAFENCFHNSWFATTWQGGHVEGQNNRIFSRRIYMKIEFSSQIEERNAFVLDKLVHLRGQPFRYHVEHSLWGKTQFRSSISYLCTVVGIALLFLFFPLSFVFNWQFFFLDFDIATLKLKAILSCRLASQPCCTCAIRLQTWTWM